MAMIRTFIACEVPVPPDFTAIQDELRGCAARMKLVDPANVHLTLKFLGDTDEFIIDDIQHKLERELEAFGPVELVIKGSGAFPKLTRPRVLCLGFSGELDRAAGLAARIDDVTEGFGFKREKRRFSPHLTIARLRQPSFDPDIKRIMESYQDAEFGTFQISRIVHKKSTLTTSGPIYKDLYEIVL